MTAPTTTAATPEELATITVRYRLPRSEAQAVMLDERARQVSWDDVFAERDAQRAEIERLTKERDASRERERKLREALTQIARSPGGLPDEDDAEGWATLASDRREIARAALQPQETADER